MNDTTFYISPKMLPPCENKKGWPWALETPLSKIPNAFDIDWPKISIVTPSYNQAEFLEATIRSVLLQGYPNLEYAVVDDGSSDHSLEIIKKYESYLAHWETGPNRGHAHTLNKGFAHTTGDIVAWINSDDMYAPGAFFAAAEIFTKFKDINWIMGRNAQWDEEGNPIRTQRIYMNRLDFLSGNYNWIEQESTFWRRSLWEQAGAYIDESQEINVDGELWCRFFRWDELWHVEMQLAGYRIHGTNRARTKRKQQVMEMEQAVSRLRALCPPEIRKKTALAKRVMPLIKFFRRFRAPRLHQAFLDALGLEYQYKRVISQNGEWAKSIDSDAFLTR